VISVVIPCYNQAHFLSEAIESVLSQTYSNFEILVVDDGSPDNVEDAVRKYPGVQYVRQANQGLSVARNNGLRHCTGDYLLFLDADDRLLANAMETQLKYFELHPECVFVSGQIQFIDPEGRPMETPEEPVIEKDHYSILLQYSYIWTAGSVLFRRSIFQNGFAFTPSLKSTGDWDIYLRITREFPVFCHPEAVVQHRRHATNMTLNSALLLKDSLATLESQWRYVKGNAKLEEALRAGIGGAKRFYGEPLVAEIHQHLKAKSWKQAFTGVKALFRYYPERLYRGASR
jgi:glycosyltransferase involved in cell wall biosynthesis